MPSLPRLRLALPLALALAVLGGVPGAGAATPPAQPKDGPGGQAYTAASVTKRALGRAGAVTLAYYGSGAAPAQGRPVVVMLHAWGAVNPQAYGAWIEHLARSGSLVLFPRFQELNRTRPADASGIAAGLVKDALAELAADPEAKPDTGRVALLGHLAGVPLAANLAAHAKETGLPVPRLIFGAMPGGIARDDKARGIALHDLNAIDPATLIVTVIGDRDARAADIAARRVMREASAVPVDHKLMVRALSDDHGFPALSATLASPAGGSPAYDVAQLKLPAADLKQKPPPFKWSADMALTGEQTVLVAQINGAGTDSLDYLAFWKTFDMAAAAAFSGQNAASLKSNPRFIDMERWSDGWPVRRLSLETPRPPAPPKPAATSAAPPPAAKPGGKPVVPVRGH
ncbi:alpha/beta hydrolase family protein [Methylobacterium platani]|uniref:Alpha/beta hydrolase n=2 Tax=Methylobacterium platani TaxID=427683 RepID=A0A179SH53_9HYPH|nr:alpha/beta hydrolase family protein [Methylobacterium platani]KMO12781.1 alpha/beta hydrolase family protein [Methylobacterium platani JCM 14648]OAS26925.1 alpha/beta hydrolase [Methylobacterium platani]